MSAPYTPMHCPLPITDPRRAYVPADHTNVAETWRQHTPIFVCPITKKEQK